MNVSIGTLVPDFTIAATGDTTVTLSALRGSKRVATYSAARGAQPSATLLAGVPIARPEIYSVLACFSQGGRNSSPQSTTALIA